MRRRRKIRGGFQYFIYVAIFFVVVLISFVLGRVSADSAANSIDVENRSLGIPEDGVALWPGGTGKDPLLTLVNAESPLPSDWQCELVSLINGQSVDSRAYEDLQEMMDDARAEGLEPYICSSWRSHEQVSMSLDWLWILYHWKIRDWKKPRRIRRRDSGLWRIVMSMALFSVIRRIKRMLRESAMNPGIIVMWVENPPWLCGPGICVLKNM